MYVYIVLVLIYTLMTIVISFFFFFNDTATTEIYTLSLHDALPILESLLPENGLITLYGGPGEGKSFIALDWAMTISQGLRSEEHTSELQSQSNLVCRLLLEKKKKK